MTSICLLKNPIQEYAWGSFTAIPELLGAAEPPNKPQAELWMGAHPKAPSLARCNGDWTPLPELIRRRPDDILGKKAAQKFNNQLPYLFKVLAAAKPLSIQAHPDARQAAGGYAREERLGVPMDAPERSYKDPHHKPECICALTTFWALCGFRKVPDILSHMLRICPTGLEKELAALRDAPNSEGLKTFFHALMTLPPDRQKEVIKHAVMNAQTFAEDHPEYKWMVNLHFDYPADIGVFSPILFNLVCLKPGQAMFLPPGELHAYLYGAGVELMANSDNVLRGGLTPKHVDVPELLNILNFEERRIDIIAPRRPNDYESVYETPAEEFALSRIRITQTPKGYIFAPKSVEIILCVAGAATAEDIEGKRSVHMKKGASVLIPGSLKVFRLKGEGTFYRAAVPV